MKQRHSGSDFSNDGQAESSLRRANRHGGTACECCGNEYECAIHKLAPKCAHCGCRIIGHGVEAGGAMYCCAHCAEKQGVREMVDRA